MISTTTHHPYNDTDPIITLAPNNNLPLSLLFCNISAVLQAFSFFLLYKKNINQICHETQKEIRRKELQEKECNNIEKYVNIDLGINIIGTSQPNRSYNFSECFKILHK